MDMDVLHLSRLQFALTIMFHYLFPPLSIGLGVILACFEGLYLKTGDRDYEELARFWTRIFAVNFAMGVATGIVMEFQFGTNWATYSRFVGDIFGSALAAEGIFAFFLESGFLAVLVFGWDKVSKRMHFFATCMVALGAFFSSVWIIVASSWQHTPAGHHIVGEGALARAEIVDFWAMVFNPSTVVRLFHVVIGAYILSAFVVLSVSAFYVLRGRHEQLSRKAFRFVLPFALVCTVLAGVSGHLSADIVAHYQPAKLAAFEGIYHTKPGGTPMILAGVPDPNGEELKYAIGIPGGLSFLVHGNFHEPVQALDTIPRENWPPLVLPFITYRMMIGSGMALMGLAALGMFLQWRKVLFKQRWLLWIYVFAVVLPYIANQAGWVSAEVGRQPWIVYGLLRTTDGISKSVYADQVLASIIMFSLIYLLLFAVFVFVLNDKIQHGPEEPEPQPRPLPEEGLFGAVAAVGKAGRASETRVPEENE
jgi:cytochrome bd ubiquinol oxidase subunit I